MKKLELDDVTRFHGHRKDMAACVSSLDVVVMCSDHEGTPMTALESMALCTPLVAHYVGGLQEVLAEHPGLQVSEHTPEAYAKQVMAILQRDGGYKVGLKDSYLCEHNASATINLYRKILRC
jgi:glycosyltransferase involved in cell wall biosynthesis